MLFIAIIETLCLELMSPPHPSPGFREGTISPPLPCSPFFLFLTSSLYLNDIVFLSLCGIPLSLCPPPPACAHLCSFPTPYISASLSPSSFCPLLSTLLPVPHSLCSHLHPQFSGEVGWCVLEMGGRDRDVCSREWVAGVPFFPREGRLHEYASCSVAQGFIIGRIPHK